MPGLHDTKRQIKSTKSTQQITRAMELVAASKLKRAQEKAVGARPYANGIEGLLKRLIESRTPLSDSLFAPGREGPVLFILVTADRGLCGGYNANMLKLFASELSAAGGPANARVTAVGRKGRDFARKQGVTDIRGYHFPDNLDYVLASRVAGDAVQSFLQGDVSEVRVLYTRFYSTVAHRPTVIELLPVKAHTQEKVDDEVIPPVPYILEPSPRHLLASLLPKYIALQVHRALLESKACELGARMIAMGAATDNAEQMINSLSLRYNRERQAAITREISEIVGGANALK